DAVQQLADEVAVADRADDVGELPRRDVEPDDVGAVGPQDAHQRLAQVPRTPGDQQPRHAPTGCQAVFSSTTDSRRVSASATASSWVCAAAPWRTRLIVSAASLSSSVPRSASPDASTIALRSRWAPSAGASSERRPDSRLTTPPGKSDTPSTSARSSPGS